MRHVEKALKWLKADNPERDYGNFIEIENIEDVKGIAPVVKFTIQSDPIGEVGVNGVQALDMLEYVKYLFKSLNDAYPCVENAHTVDAIDEAIFWQNERTKDRISRSVEGKNEA